LSEKPVQPHPPSGEQHEIQHGDQVVVVTEVGATLRTYAAGGLDVLDGFSVDEPSSAGRGQVLAPWPNRLDGGRYEFDGRPGAAAIDEPQLGNAIHGIVRWLPWLLASKTDDAVALGCVLHPQPAYPWRLELSVEYRLGADGLSVATQAANASSEPAP
jgi:aldose 1-epimerase